MGSCYGNDVNAGPCQVVLVKCRLDTNSPDHQLCRR